MENNRNTDNFNSGSGNTSIDLRTAIPEWLSAFFQQPMVCISDINENVIEGYPIDDEF